MLGYHLAQCNIGRLLAPLDSEQLAGFVAALDPINALADRAPGFVWRLQTDEGNATAVRPFDDDMIAINMSVWESIEALETFTNDTAHRDILRQRRRWFERMAEAHMVLGASLPARSPRWPTPRTGSTTSAATGRHPPPSPSAPPTLRRMRAWPGGNRAGNGRQVSSSARRSMSSESCHVPSLPSS